MKKITIKIDTKEDNNKIKNCFKTYLLNSLESEKQIIEIVVEDLKEKEK